MDFIDCGLAADLPRAQTGETGETRAKLFFLGFSWVLLFRQYVNFFLFVFRIYIFSLPFLPFLPFFPLGFSENHPSEISDSAAACPLTTALSIVPGRPVSIQSPAR